MTDGTKKPRLDRLPKPSTLGLLKAGYRSICCWRGSIGSFGSERATAQAIRRLHGAFHDLVPK